MDLFFLVEGRTEMDEMGTVLDTEVGVIVVRRASIAIFIIREPTCEAQSGGIPMLHASHIHTICLVPLQRLLQKGGVSVTISLEEAKKDLIPPGKADVSQTHRPRRF